MIQQLQALIIRLRSQLNRAEAHVPTLNSVIARLTELNLIPERTLLGHIVHMRDYEPGSGIIDSGMVLQAALQIPGGLGIVVWDTEEYVRIRNTPEGLIVSVTETNDFQNSQILLQVQVMTNEKLKSGDDRILILVIRNVFAINGLCRKLLKSNNLSFVTCA